MRESSRESANPTSRSLAGTHTVKSFGAGVVINYEYNEFVREQSEKRRGRAILAGLIVFFPACILFAWGITHLVLGLNAVTSSSRLTAVINQNVQVALATIQLNFESGDMAYVAMTGSSDLTNLTIQQNRTDQIIQSKMLWDKPTIAADRPMYPSGQYTFVTYADLHAFLVGHRQDFSTGLPSLSGATDSSLAMAVLGQWQWYRGLTTDIYAQITTNFLANTDLPIWPNFLDTDYAVMYHRMLNHKRILGALLLHQGASFSGKLSIWYDLIGYISNEELLYSSAFFMAPGFRRFVRDIQTNENSTQTIDWTIVRDCENLIQNLYLFESMVGISFLAVPAKAEAYFREMTKVMELVQAYALLSSGEILTGLADQEGRDYAKCVWSAVLLLVTLGGGFLNACAIWSFIQHFVTQVRESAVEHRDRTLDLRLERRKTNMVLHSMLPRKVADELKFRKFVRPTYYESVSMYFSDVQGFTALSSRSRPQDIVVMLTELYSKFDDILNDYKVWKLETIGDAYCIIAGATNQHEFDRPMEHAIEIVNCSLEIRDYIRHYPIPHIPEELVKIRIGVHTGSVVAGVAGVGMHRYCVVGEALHVVEQVEASGMHGRIHISEDAKNAVFSLPSSETLNQPSPDTSHGSINQAHPNAAVYVCVPNTDSELIMHDQVIKTYWIDRWDSDFARSLEGAMVQQRSYGEFNLLRPGQEALLMHRTSHTTVPAPDSANEPDAADHGTVEQQQDAPTVLTLEVPQTVEVQPTASGEQFHITEIPTATVGRE